MHVLCILTKVTGLMTQGRADGHEFVTSFVVSYSLDSINWYYIVDQYDNKLVRTTRSVVTHQRIYDLRKEGPEGTGSGEAPRGLIE